MADVTMRDMLEAGLHYGHQTKRWNPKMKPYIYGPRNGIYIINLDHTMVMFRKAYSFLVNEVARGGSLLFVGTKVQGREIIADEAGRCGMYYVNQRWLGGMLTNFQTIRRSIERLKQIDAMREDGTINRFPKKEILMMDKEAEKLERHLGGIKQMRSLPSVLFVVDPKKEHIAVDEANKLGIPVVAITDTNCDPDLITYVIPGNDDAIRAIKLISSLVADAVLEGKAQCVDGTEEGTVAAPEALLDDMAAKAGEEMVEA